ncbi:MAG: hypothetical protein V4539_10230 [Bacteroidota bacterium]
MDKLMKQLKISNILSKRRVSVLSRYDRQIRSWLERGKNITKICEHLKLREVAIHYSTVQKYVQALKKDQTCQTLTNLPGEMAYVSLLKVKSSENAYLFCFLMGYSHYSYFCILHNVSLAGFMQCHIQCFKELGGAPKRIQFCEVSCLRLSHKDKADYRCFLGHYGSRKVVNNEKGIKQMICLQQNRKAKDDILSSFFHNDVKKLATALKTKHTYSFNYASHPVTQRLIAKEFEQTEKGKLMPLPVQDYPVPVIRIGKVTERGRINFCCHEHKLPRKYAGHTVELTLNGQKVSVRLGNKIIAEYFLPNQHR